MEKMNNGATSKSGQKAQARGKGKVSDVDVFLSTLPLCLSEEKLDNFAFKLFSSHNTVEAKDKLIKILCDVKSVALDKIPFYARLVTLLDPVCPEITHAVCCYLKNSICEILKDQEKCNVLIKFKHFKFVVALIEWHIFFDDKSINYLKLFLSTYKHQWSEFYSNNLERLVKLATFIIMKYTSKIETELLLSGNRECKFNIISKLIFKDMLTPGKELRVVEIIKKLNWDDLEVNDFVIKCLSSPWEVKFEEIENFAGLVTELSKTFKNIVGDVTIAVFNQIMTDTYLNSTNYRRRLSTIRYLGELYNFDMIDSSTIFDALYFLIISGFNPKIVALLPSDPPRSLIRIRAVLLLIKTCKDYLSSADEIKLRHFLIYFQYYYWSKKSSPIWSEFFTIPTAIHKMMTKYFEEFCPSVRFPKSSVEASIILEELRNKMIPESDSKNNPDHVSHFPGFDMHKICYHEDEIPNDV